MAARANVQRLVVTHQGPNLARPGSMEKALAEMAAIFKGELIFGEEFVEMDWDGKVILKWDAADLHHGFYRMPNGNTMICEGECG